MKDHADYWTEEQIDADLARIAEEIRTGRKSEDELERDAYFNDPANADEIAEMFARMELVETLYKARHEAGLTQKELARRLGTTRPISRRWNAAGRTSRSPRSRDTPAPAGKKCPLPCFDRVFSSPA